jgi:hypothetical protein
MLMIGTTELAKRLYDTWRREGMATSMRGRTILPTWDVLPSIDQSRWRRVAERAVNEIATAAGAAFPDGPRHRFVPDPTNRSRCAFELPPVDDSDFALCGEPESAHVGVPA